MRRALPVLAISVIAICSCTNNRQLPVEQRRPKTAAAARAIAESFRVSDDIDTLPMRFYLGMSKAETDILVKKYIKEKKIRREYNPLSKEYYLYCNSPIEGIPSNDAIISFRYCKDTLSILTFGFGDYYMNDARKTLFSFDCKIGPSLSDKGYWAIYEGFSDDDLDILLHKVNMPTKILCDPNLNPRMKTEVINYFKGNTNVMILFSGFPFVSYRDLYAIRQEEIIE